MPLGGSGSGCGENYDDDDNAGSIARGALVGHRSGHVMWRDVLPHGP